MSNFVRYLVLLKDYFYLLSMLWHSRYFRCFPITQRTHVVHNRITSFPPSYLSSPFTTCCSITLNTSPGPWHDKQLLNMQLHSRVVQNTAVNETSRMPKKPQLYLLFGIGALDIRWKLAANIKRKKQQNDHHCMVTIHQINVSGLKNSFLFRTEALAGSAKKNLVERWRKEFRNISFYL